MLRPTLVVTASALLCACAASGPADGGGSKPTPGAEALLPIATYLDSAALHQALLNAPPPPPAVTRRTLYMVEFDSTGAVSRVVPLFRRNAPAEYVQEMERVVRAHVKPQAPGQKPEHLIVWLTSGPTASIRPVNRLAELRPNLRNTMQITDELERSVQALLHAFPIYAGAQRTAVLKMVVSDEGVPAPATVLRSAGDLWLDREMIRIAAMMRFTPARIEEFPVAVLVQIPVSMTFPSPPGENNRNR